MGGRAARRKGKVAEYEVRDYFRNKGYPCIRVPLSGASEGYKGDVEVDLGLPSKIYGEVKSRKKEFTSVYALLDTLMKGKAGIVSNGEYSALLSYHFEDLGFKMGTLDIPMYEVPKEYKRTVGKIMTMQKWVESSQFLVVKDNHKRLLFIRYLW